jgi:hypothetical protein
VAIFTLFQNLFGGTTENILGLKTNSFIDYRLHLKRGFVDLTNTRELTLVDKSVNHVFAIDIITNGHRTVGVLICLIPTLICKNPQNIPTGHWQKCIK